MILSKNVNKIFNNKDVSNSNKNIELNNYTMSYKCKNCNKLLFTHLMFVKKDNTITKQKKQIFTNNKINKYKYFTKLSIVCKIINLKKNDILFTLNLGFFIETNKQNLIYSNSYCKSKLSFTNNYMYNLNNISDILTSIESNLNINCKYCNILIGLLVPNKDFILNNAISNLNNNTINKHIKDNLNNLLLYIDKTKISHKLILKPLIEDVYISKTFNNQTKKKDSTLISNNESKVNVIKLNDNLDTNIYDSAITCNKIVDKNNSKINLQKERKDLNDFFISTINLRIINNYKMYILKWISLNNLRIIVIDTLDKIKQYIKT